jgi:circadian clock protein KaiB
LKRTAGWGERLAADLQAAWQAMGTQRWADPGEDRDEEKRLTPPREAGGDTANEAQPAASAEEIWELCLYVTGRSPTCVRALANLQRACAHWLPGRYHIEIIDLLENPLLAAEYQILAVPTLVKKHPPPIRKVVGDLADTGRLRLLFGM